MHKIHNLLSMFLLNLGCLADINQCYFSIFLCTIFIFINILNVLVFIFNFNLIFSNFMFSFQLVFNF